MGETTEKAATATIPSSTAGIKPATTPVTQSAIELPQQATQPPRQEEDPTRQEMAKVLMEILNIAGELAFELADIDDPKIIETGLYKKAKEIVRRLKRLKQIIEKQNLVGK